jgi:hypothetical protein
MSDNEIKADFSGKRIEILEKSVCRIQKKIQDIQYDLLYLFDMIPTIDLQMEDDEDMGGL